MKHMYPMDHMNLMNLMDLVKHMSLMKHMILQIQKRDKTRCASFISLSRRSPHTNTSHSAAAHCWRKLKQARGILSPRLIWILLYMWKWGLVVDQLVLIVPAVQLADLSSDLL